jgi:hypothetical protein
MPFWPIYIVILAWMIYEGYRAGAWFAPALILAGLVAMRCIVAFFDPVLHSVAACTLWLCVSVIMGYKGAKVPAFFLCLSGLSYGAFWLLGVRFEYLSIMLVAADTFGLLALVSIGGGLLAARRNSRRARSGFLDRVSVATLGVARSEARGFVPVESGSKMIYGKR